MRKSISFLPHQCRHPPHSDDITGARPALNLLGEQLSTRFNKPIWATQHGIGMQNYVCNSQLVP